MQLIKQNPVNSDPSSASIQAVVFYANLCFDLCPLQYSPSMRNTYLSMTDAQVRHFGTDFQV